MQPPPDEPARVKVVNVPHGVKVSAVEGVVAGVPGFDSWQTHEHVHVNGRTGTNFFLNLSRSEVSNLKKALDTFNKKDGRKQIDIKIVKDGVQKKQRKRKQAQRRDSKCVNLQVCVEKSSQHFAGEGFKPLVEEWVSTHAQTWSVQCWGHWIPDKKNNKPEKDFECHLLLLEFDSSEIATKFVTARRVDAEEVAPGVRCFGLQKHPNPRIFGTTVQLSQAVSTTTNQHTDGQPPRPRNEDPPHVEAYYDCPAELEDPRPMREVARAGYARLQSCPPSEPEHHVHTHPHSSSVQDAGTQTRFVTESRLRPSGSHPRG